MKIEQWRSSAFERFKKAGIEVSETRLEITFIIEAVMGLNRSQQMLYPQQGIEPSQLQQLENMVSRRCQREPLAHILGEWSFWGLDFKVSPDTLIPRADTEVLVEEVLTYLETVNIDHKAQDFWLCDVGTGTGCIALALASEKKDLSYQLLDISEQALLIAQENTRNLYQKHELAKHTQICFAHSDLLSIYDDQQLPRPQVIVSNPPYVKRAIQESLMPEVKFFDPDLALFDEAKDGLDLTRRLIQQATNILPPKGALFIEVGFDQTEKTEQLFKEYLFKQVKTRKDYGGNPRVVSGIK